MCSSMRVFLVFIWIAHLGRGTRDPFHERPRAVDRLGRGSAFAHGHGTGIVTIDQAVPISPIRR